MGGYASVPDPSPVPRSVPPKSTGFLQSLLSPTADPTVCVQTQGNDLVTYSADKEDPVKGYTSAAISPYITPMKSPMYKTDKRVECGLRFKANKPIPYTTVTVPAAQLHGAAITPPWTVSSDGDLKTLGIDFLESVLTLVTTTVPGVKLKAGVQDPLPIVLLNGRLQFPSGLLFTTQHGVPVLPRVARALQTVLVADTEHVKSGTWKAFTELLDKLRETTSDVDAEPVLKQYLEGLEHMEPETVRINSRTLSVLGAGGNGCVFNATDSGTRPLKLFKAPYHLWTSMQFVDKLSAIDPYGKFSISMQYVPRRVRFQDPGTVRALNDACSARSSNGAQSPFRVPKDTADMLAPEVTETGVGSGLLRVSPGNMNAAAELWPLFIGLVMFAAHNYPHNDIKDSNVLLVEDDRFAVRSVYKYIDFDDAGLEEFQTKATRQGFVIKYGPWAPEIVPYENDLDDDDIKQYLDEYFVETQLGLANKAIVFEGMNVSGSVLGAPEDFKSAVEVNIDKDEVAPNELAVAGDVWALGLALAKALCNSDSLPLTAALKNLLPLVCRMTQANYKLRPLPTDILRWYLTDVYYVEQSRLPLPTGFKIIDAILKGFADASARPTTLPWTHTPAIRGWPGVLGTGAGAGAGAGAGITWTGLVDEEEEDGSAEGGLGVPPTPVLQPIRKKKPSRKPLGEERRTRQRVDKW